MALLRSSLVLLLWLFIVGCGSVIALHPGDERLLTSSNITLAQARVDRQTKHADTSTVSGLAVKLHYVRNGILQGAAVDLRIQGEDGVANYMLVDTGSSSLSFCNASLASSIQNLKTKYAQGITYGETKTCNDEGERCESINGSSESDSKGQHEWYYGSVYKGNVEVYDKKSIYTMPNIYYAVMDGQKGMTCEYGFDGIIGVAFQNLNSMKELPSVDTSAEVLLPKSCKSEECPLRRKSNNNYPKVVEPSPIQEALEDKSSTQQAFGIYFDYLTATNYIDDDGNTRDLGILYAGDLATDNIHYKNGRQQVATSIKYGGNRDYWSINVLSMEIEGDPKEIKICADGSKCYVDSGTPTIILPLTDSDCTNMFANATDDLKLHMQGMGDEIVTLEIPVEFLSEQYNKNKVECSGIDGKLVLGFPVFSYYYVAFGFSDDSITFVNTTKQASFVDSKEPGAPSTSSSWSIDLWYQWTTVSLLLPILLL